MKPRPPNYAKRGARGVRLDSITDTSGTSVSPNTPGTSKAGYSDQYEKIPSVPVQNQVRQGLTEGLDEAKWTNRVLLFLALLTSFGGAIWWASSIHFRVDVLGDGRARADGELREFGAKLENNSRNLSEVTVELKRQGKEIEGLKEKNSTTNPR